MDSIFSNQATRATLIAVIALPVISLGLAVLLRAFVKVEQSYNKAYFVKGDRFQYRLTVKNPTIIPCPIRMTFAEQSKMFYDVPQDQFSFMPFGSHDFGTEIKCKYRGIYKIGVDNVCVQDFLGLVRFKYQNVQATTIIVYPRVIDLSEVLKINRDWRIDEQDDADIQDFRNYQPSDSMKRIHWKLSVKKQDLIVKEFIQNPDVASDALFIDFSRTQDDLMAAVEQEDRVIETAVAVAYSLSNYKLNYDLIGALDSNLFYSSSDFKSVYERLATERFGGSFCVHDLLYDYYENDNHLVRWWIITTQVTDAFTTELLNAVSGGNPAQVFIISDKKVKNIRDENVLKLIENDIKVTYVGPHQNLHSQLRAKDRA